MPAERVGVVSNAIDPARFRPQPEAGRRAPARAGRPDDAFLIGCLTRFNAKKRNDVAIDAAVRLAAHARPARAPADDRRGRDRGRAARARRAARPSAAHFVPSTGAEPAELLSACDVVVFCPSPTEGEPLAISMGMLVERPVRGHRRRGRDRPDRARHRRDRHARPRRRGRRALLAGYRGDPERARAEGRAARELAAARHDPAVVGERAEALLADRLGRPQRQPAHRREQAADRPDERREARIHARERADRLDDRQRQHARTAAPARRPRQSGSALRRQTCQLIARQLAITAR